MYFVAWKHYADFNYLGFGQWSGPACLIWISSLMPGKYIWEVRKEKEEYPLSFGFFFHFLPLSLFVGNHSTSFYLTLPNRQRVSQPHLQRWDLISVLHLRSSDSYYADADVSHSSSLAWWKLKPKLWMKYVLAAKQFKPSTVTYIVLVVISSTARGTRVLKRLR